MAGKPTITEGNWSGFSGPVMLIVEELAGKSLAEAENLVEMARRLLWVHLFSGETAPNVERAFNACSDAAKVARDISALCDGSLFHAEELILELRLCLYMSAYGEARGTRFGDHMQSHLKEQRRYQSPVGLQ